MSDLDEIMSAERLDAAAEASLKLRRARRETMMYRQGDWLVLEYGDGRIARIARAGELNAEQILARIEDIKAEQHLAKV